MMKCIVRFFENAKRAIVDSVKNEKKISWAIIADSCEGPFLKLTKMKFLDPKTPKDEMLKYFTDLYDEIDNEFRRLLIG